MDKFTKAVLYMFIPAFTNMGIFYYLYLNYGWSAYQGYLVGTALSIIFSLVWIFQIGQGHFRNFFHLLKFTFASFFVKLVFFSVFIAGSYFVFKIDRSCFAAAFFLGTIISVIIEIWYFVSTYRQYR